MYRVLLGFHIVPLDGGHTGLRVSFQAGPAGKDGGRTAMEIVIEPIGVPVGTDFDGWTIAEGLANLASLFGVDAIGQIAKLTPPAPWDKLFNQVQISPSLRLEPVGDNPSIMLKAQLFETGKPHDSGVTIGGQIAPGISIEPEMTVYDLVAGYSSGSGLDLKAHVLFQSTDSAPKRLPAPGDADPTPPNGKPQLVSYPFPLPDQNKSAAFKLNFLGLGQRFAPTIDINVPDPLANAFDLLEKTFTSDDPETIINTLVADYYRPDVGWFFALHLDVRGFTVRAVLADPVLYGLEITCDDGPFKGLLAEILYQKIGSDLGVFYGKIVLPDNIRQINVGAGSLTIPSFEVWIYTNGDFKVAIGWPLGPNSLSLQIYVFMGEAALYFGRLRSGDNPTGRTAPQVVYNPILVFGLALRIGVGRSFQKGPISAEASLTLTGVFQGLLAWKAANAQGGGSGIARNPDYYWFSASVTLAGVVQGSVDLGIISAGVSIRIWATIATAFETNSNTVVHAEVGVDVSVSVKIVFFTIHIHFSATIDLSFTLIGGYPKDAQVDGPSDPDLRAFIPSARAVAPPMLRMMSAPGLAASGAGPTINLSFILQPAVPYSAAGAGAIAAVATLLIPSPDPAKPAGGTDFEVLVDLATPWLLAHWGGQSPTWEAVATALGASGQPGPGDFESNLSQLLSGVTFEITGVDLSKTQASSNVALFPMLDALKLTVGGTSWNFGNDPLTYSGYPAALAQYFALLSALTPKMPAPGGAASATEPDGPSLSHLLYVNWFLSMARQIASAMADAEKKSGGSLPPGSLPTTATVTTIAGMLSRMVLHGARLPDPAIVHGPMDPPITEDIIHPLFSLDHQQFPGTVGAPLTASLSLGATGTLNIRFASGDNTTAVLPGGTPPPEPNPGWHAGSDSAPGIAVSAIDPLVQGPLTFAVTARTQGTGTLFPGPATPANAQVLTLPAASIPFIAAGGATGTLRPQPDQTSAPTPFAPGLLVPMSLRRVPITVGSDLEPSQTGGAPSVVPAWSPDVYALIGTDDDTRDLLEQAMDSGKVRRIVPLTFQSNALTAATLDLANHPVLAFKSNLSTTSQPNMLMTPMLLMRRAPSGDPLGPVSARLDAVGDFLRLVWEASVVHTSGFYLRYEDAQGNGLPDSLFDKDVARFWLWLDLGGTDAPSIPPFANSLVIADTGDASKATQYLSLVTAQGAVTGWKPAFPPGFVGAQLLWNKPPEGDGALWSAASVAALYHMIELQIGGGAFDTTLWSTALSPVDQQKDNNGLVVSATYRQVVPAWSFLATPVQSPYAAVGASVPLNFRLSDVYGNVLADPSRQYAMKPPVPVVYNDPLLAPSSWPACHAAYDIGKDPKTGAPTLSVVVTLDPAGLQSHAATLRALENGAALGDESLQSARTTWTTIAQQVHDPNFSASVSSSLYGDADSSGAWPVVGDSASTLSQLRSLVDTLNGVIQGPSPTKTTASLSLPLSFASIVARPSDIFSFGVGFTFMRSNVDQGIAQRLPSVKQIVSLLPPLLPPPTGNTGDPAPLVIWAGQVEKTLKGFDGGAGQIKLAQRPMSAADDAGDGSGLWAVRLSVTAGISVTAGQGAPVFFTMQPFSTSLQYGAVDVTTWDADLKPTTATSSAASVDPDLQAQDFLAAFDRLMAPDLAAGIARIDGATQKNAFATLMQGKSTIASVLSKRLIPIFTDQASGDFDEATIQFEQSLLAQLSNAYATAAVAQVPLAVSVTGTAEGGAALPPRLFGGLATTPADGAPPYTLTSPKLALDGRIAPWLTFLATVKEPDTAVRIDLQPKWTVSYIEHDFEVSEKAFGYLPSGWLKFVVPDTTTPSLNVPLGDVDIPVPLRRYPALPVMVSQVAAPPPDSPPGSGLAAGDDPIQDAIRKALRWPLTLTIGKAEQAGQDDLWVTSTFNHPINWAPAETAGPGPMTPLTQALVRFQAGFTSIAPLLPLLEGTDPKAGKLIDVLVKLIGDVVTALLPPPAGLAEMPAVEKLIWVLRYADVKQGKLTVFGRLDPAGASTPLLFPVINGVQPGPLQPANPNVAPDSQPWQMTTYTFAQSVPKTLVMAISDLDVLIDQTVIGSAHVDRNVDLGGGGRVDPRLIYQTPEIFFSNVLVPYTEVTQTLGPMQAGPVADMLTSVLKPFVGAGIATGQRRTVRVAIAYNYPLVSTAGTAPLMATIPVLLNAGSPLTDDPAPIAQALADALATWARQVPLPRQGASLSVSVSLFITVQSSQGVDRSVPLLTVDRIDLMLPGGWP